MGETCCQVGWNSPCPSFLFSFPSLHLLAFLLERNNKHQPENTILANAAQRNSPGGAGGAGQVLIQIVRRNWGCLSEMPLCFLGPLQLPPTRILTEPPLTQKTCSWLRLGSGQPASSCRRTSLPSPPLGAHAGRPTTQRVSAAAPARCLLKTGPLSLFPPRSWLSSGWARGVGLRKGSQMEAVDGFRLGARGRVGTRLRGERCPE